MQYSDTAHVHAVSAVDGVAQSYDANGNMTERVIDGVTYTQGWDQENRLVWVSTGGVTTTFTYDANGALVKKEDPLVGTTYYVGPHYEVLVPAIILPPAPTDLEACRESGSPPNVCNYLSWTGSAGVTYNVYSNSTSPVPIDAGHRVTSGITETNYTDCGNVNNRYYAVTAVNENGESDPSNEDRASEPCGSAMAMTLPVLNAAALTESGGDSVVTKYYFAGGKRVAMDRDGVVQWLVGDHLGTTSLVLDANGTVHSEARHYPYGEERWSSGTVPTDYRFTGQRSDSYIKLVHMGVRHYDPALGRWISADTIVPDPANPQSFNRYSYCYGNPLRFVDPTGMFTEEELVGWGAYTWDEIEALRGTAWYAILMEAQLGDSVYFGNGIDYYTGPMGMGTFYMSEGKLFVGGDVHLWNRDKGGYDSHKVWDSAQQWGELFELASLRPDSYGLLPALEEADYAVFSMGFACPPILPYPLGCVVSVIKDKDDNWYGAIGASVGEAVPLSVNLSWGHLEDPETNIEGFLTGVSGYSNAGTLVGAGWVSNGSVSAMEAGFYSPQFGGGTMWGFPLRWLGGFFRFFM